jgi:hypothetical protein
MVGLAAVAGLAYSLVLTDAAIAPAFPNNTPAAAFPIVLSVASGLEPGDPGRRLGGYQFCSMAPRCLLPHCG